MKKKVRIYGKTEADLWEKWGEKYGAYEVVETPEIINGNLEAKVLIRNIEEYAQWSAYEWGMTTPDARIFYRNGTVKEFYK